MKLVDLMTLQEIDFPNQRAFDQYSKNHKLRPDTKVTVAGRVTTAGRASLNSKDIKGTSVFGKQNTPKDLESSVENHLNRLTGGNGYTQKEDGSGAIIYNMGDGDNPTYTLYMGKEGDKHRVTLEPTYGNDPKKLQGKIDKSFDKVQDAVNFMGDVAKKYRKELEMDDSGGNAKKKSTPQDNDVFDGGENVLNKVTDLLPPGTGFTNKKTGDKITVQRYDGDNMYVSYDKVPGKELKWPMKQFLKMTQNKELQFNPKQKETPKEDDSKKFPFTVTHLDKTGNRIVADKFVSKRDADRFKGMIDPKHKPEVVPTADVNKPSVDTNSLFKNISKLTDNNDHNQAAMELAKFTGDKTYIEQIQKIQNYHDQKGSMPQSLIQYRTAIVNNLISQISKKYGEKAAKQISKAF